jgi:hypothetical protein
VGNIVRGSSEAHARWNLRTGEVEAARQLSPEPKSALDGMKGHFVDSSAVACKPVALSASKDRQYG